MHKPSVTDTAFYGGKKRKGTPRQRNCVTLLDTNQVVRILPPGEVPLKDIYPKGKNLSLPDLLRSLKVAFGRVYLVYDYYFIF